MSLHQSLNSPYLAIPGKQAGPARGFIVGLRGSRGFSVYVYLYLAEVPDCAIYASTRRHVSSEEYRDEEDEAIAFVESMGFMMDTMNFRALPADRQAELLQTLPIFKRQLQPVTRSPKTEKDSNETASPLAKLLGRIFSSF